MARGRRVNGIGPRPLIVYIPGLKPKPEAGRHIEQLLRCLLTGVQRLDGPVAADLANGDTFQLVSWTYDFYGEHRDIDLDLADIEALLQKRQASEADIAAATSAHRRFLIWLFQLADYLPFVIPKIATEEVQVHLRDFFRYVRDEDGRAQAARDRLKGALRGAFEAGRPLLLLAHSMGSVIAYDTLWELSRVDESDVAVDLFLTTGSPLGQNLVQRHLRGKGLSGPDRYPANIRRWVNIAAFGELTAIDRRLRNDFAAMVRDGLVSDIEDREVFNYYRMHGTLNVHAEYGYLVNEVTARCVLDWWRANATG